MTCSRTCSFAVLAAKQLVHQHDCQARAAPSLGGLVDSHGVRLVMLQTTSLPLLSGEGSCLWLLTAVCVFFLLQSLPLKV